MKRVFLLFGIALLCLTLGQAVNAKDELIAKKPSLSEQEYVPREVIVKFKSGTSEATIGKVYSKHGATLFRKSRFAQFQRIRIPHQKTVAAMVAQLSQDPNIEYAEPNYIAHAHWTPNDTYYPNQWHLKAVNAPKAWDLTSGSPEVIVAVIDTGVAYEDYTHGWGTRKKSYFLAPDLASTNFVEGYDFVSNDTHANDDKGHGTHVTGTIAQTTNNAMGTAGLAFNTTIMPVKVLDENGSGSYSDVADGIRFAADNDANIINLSLGGPSASITLKSALKYAHDKGVTIVCSAGNNGSPTTLSYPAAYDEYCIAVGATRYDENFATYTNRGNSLDLVAPGGDLTVDQDGDGYPDGVLQQTFSGSTNHWSYWFYQGTSMAAPHVSGAAALVIAKGIATTPADVRAALESTAKDLGSPGWDSDYGYGQLDTYAALQWNSGSTDDPPTLSILQPADGATVSGTIELEVAASDDIGIDFVEFHIDGNLQDSVVSYPYKISWNSVNVTDGTHNVSATAFDISGQTDTASITIDVDNINDAPVADAGDDQTITDTDGNGSEAVTLDASASFDPDGTIASFKWTADSTQLGISQNITVDFPVGIHIVILTVTDDDGSTDTDVVLVTVTEKPDSFVAFYDSFEVATWNGLWTEDRQNDWFRSTQRALVGVTSAEVDGRAKDSQLISQAIDLLGLTNATITFSWYIEGRLDLNEYLAFDTSTNGGLNWTEQAKLKANIDPENSWQDVSVDLSGINNLTIRFRGKMSLGSEDANVDNVRVVAY